MTSPSTSQAANMLAAAAASTSAVGAGSPLIKTSPAAASPFVGGPASSLTPSQLSQQQAHPPMAAPMTPFSSATPMPPRSGGGTGHATPQRRHAAQRGGAGGPAKKARTMQDDIDEFQAALSELERKGDAFYDAMDASLGEAPSSDAQASLETLLSSLSQTLNSLSRSVLGGIPLNGASDTSTPLEDRISALRAKGGASDDAYERRQRLVEASRAVAHVLSATTTTAPTRSTRQEGSGA